MINLTTDKTESKYMTEIQSNKADFSKSNANAFSKIMDSATKAVSANPETSSFDYSSKQTSSYDKYPVQSDDKTYSTSQTLYETKQKDYLEPAKSQDYLEPKKSDLYEKKSDSYEFSQSEQSHQQEKYEAVKNENHVKPRETEKAKEPEKQEEVKSSEDKTRPEETAQVKADENAEPKKETENVKEKKEKAEVEDKPKKSNEEDAEQKPAIKETAVPLNVKTADDNLKDKIQLAVLLSAPVTPQQQQVAAKEETQAPKKGNSEKAVKQDAVVAASSVGQDKVQSKIVTPQTSTAVNVNKNVVVGAANANAQQSVKPQAKAVDNKHDANNGAHSANDTANTGVLVSNNNAANLNMPAAANTQSDKLAALGEKVDSKVTVKKIEIEGGAGKGLNSHDNKGSLAETKLASELVKPELTTVGTAKDKPLHFEKVLESRQEPRVNAESVINQVNKGISKEMSAEKSSITMSLRPESLGKVDISLVSEKGVLTAQILTESTQAKEMLSKGLDSLKQSLQEQGIAVNNIVVQVQEPSSSNTANNGKSFEQGMSKFENQNQNGSRASDNSGSENQNSRQGSDKMSDSSMNEPLANEETTSGRNTKELAHAGQIDYRI